MQDIPPIEPIPELNGGCRALALAITSLFYIVPFLCGLWFWLEFDDLFISLGIFLFLQIVSGVIVSKLRVISFSADQGEISYSTYEVVLKYLDRYFCKNKDKNDVNMSGLIDLN